MNYLSLIGGCIIASVFVSACSSSSNSSSSSGVDFVENSAPTPNDLADVTKSVDSALPSYGSNQTVARGFEKLRHGIEGILFPSQSFAIAAPVNATENISALWASINNTDKIQPPGGVVQTDEAYPNITGIFRAGEDVENVNLQDFIGYHLESGYARSNDDGIFKPTLFGQLDGMFNVLGVLAGGIPGAMAAGTYDFCVREDDTMTLDNVACPDPIDDTVFSVSVEVVDISTEQSLFDRAVQVSAGGDPFVWYWIRNSVTALNVLQLEPVNQDRNAVGINTLLQNKETGEMRFEYLNVSDDSENDAQSKLMRLLIEGGDDADVYFAAFEGNSGGPGTYHNAFIVAAESAVLADAAAFAEVSMNIEDQRDSTSASITGTICVDLADGSVTSSSSCAVATPDLTVNSGAGFIEFVQEAIDVTDLNDIQTAYNVNAWTDAADALAGPSGLFTNAGDFDSSILSP
ncbi:hypothetical protein A3762_10010 [Oleiphilus sp. HI0125]|uniref:hypothetical protein n=1 Tax=Oleiphilus sp. HI0125 TaxID=1822266 RepID=UPI0007C25047|nr:hypothetical protein [Oleiphilus sp. HI0125]KZZ57495.1 hypothetical protein A3762_10010 [Oleiphilus sp. HI0125]